MGKRNRRGALTAAQLHRAARAVGPEGRFTERKVYLSEALAELGTEPQLHEHELAELHRRGEITLHRLDLVAAGDAYRTKRSEIELEPGRSGTAVHFIELPARGPLFYRPPRRKKTPKAKRKKPRRKSKSYAPRTIKRCKTILDWWNGA